MSKILVIDDEYMGRETIQALLEGQGYSIETAEDGESGIAIAEKMLPDLIILDVMMPRLDGFAVCRQLRAHPLLNEVPVLIVTALDDRASRLLGISSGADDYLYKPLDGEELRVRARTTLRLNRYQTLLNQREGIKEMAARVIQAHEEERLRISHEIHDDIGQTLFLHHMSLEALRVNIEAGNFDCLSQSIHAVIAESNVIFAKLRLLAQDLRPPLLDTVGLRGAVRALCEDFSRRTEIPIEYEDEEVLSLPADVVQITLYRVLQEALSNIARHSQATKVWVSLVADGQEISLTVQDNGVGISPADLEKSGIGIRGMEERATLAGGVYYLRTTPRQGTVVSARFPLNQNQEIGHTDDSSHPR